MLTNDTNSQAGPSSHPVVGIESAHSSRKRSDTSSKRACDACRCRRVKCNGDDPCDRCLRSEIQCSYLVRPRKKGPASGKVIKQLRGLHASQKEVDTPSSSSLVILQPPMTPISMFSSSSIYSSASLLAEVQPLIARCLTTFIERYYELSPTIDVESTLTRFSNKEHFHNQTFASLLLSLSALIMLMPGFAQEGEVPPDRLIDEAAKLHGIATLGDDPNLDAIATSMMIGGFAMGRGNARSSYLRSREALSLAELMQLDRLSGYESLEDADKERAFRLMSILSSGGRICAMVQGRPFKMHFRPAELTQKAYDRPSRLLRRLRGITSLFEAFDPDTIDCCNGTCHDCSFNANKALLIQSQLEGVQLDPLQHPAEIADIILTKRWLQAKVWQICVTHSVIDQSGIPELGIAYPLILLEHLRQALATLPFSALESNGRSMGFKLEDSALIAETVLALSPSPFSQAVIDNAYEALGIVRNTAQRVKQVLWFRCDRTK